MKSRYCIAVAATFVPWALFVACSSAPVPESSIPAVYGEKLPPVAAQPSATSSASASASGSAVVASASASASASTAVATSASASASVAVDPTKVWKLTGAVNNSKGKPAGFSVVYLENGPIVEKRAATATIGNKDMTFLPFVSVVYEGGSVTFINDDPFPHNAYSPDGGGFNLGLFSKGQPRVHKFPKAGSYRILCNLHPGMLAYVVVIPSSFYAITNAKGQFTMKDVPEGTYKVVVWNRDGTSDEKSLTISGADATADFALHK